MVVYMKYPHIAAASGTGELKNDQNGVVSDNSSSDNANTTVNGVRSRHPAAALNYLTQTKVVAKATSGSSNPFLASSSGKTGTSTFVGTMKEKDDIV